MSEYAEKMDRKTVLLKAAFDLLKQQRDVSYVVNVLHLQARYDGTDCDGLCLMEDIATELGIDLD